LLADASIARLFSATEFFGGAPKVITPLSHPSAKQTRPHTIVQKLLAHFPGSRINFDLQDCDKILRVEGKTFSVDQVMMLVCQNGFHCEILN